MSVAADPKTELLEELEQGPLENYAWACLKIKTKGAKVEPLAINLAQSIAEEQAERQLAEMGVVRLVILKARQEGISTWVAGRYFRHAHLQGELQGLIVCDLKKRSETLWKIYDRFADNLPAPLAVGRKRTRYQQNLALDNGSAIQVETAEDVDAGRSMTIQRLHASEVAMWQNADEAWTALSEAVPDPGEGTSEIILESTPKGVGNFFHRFWVDAEEGRSPYIPIFLPWWIHERYTVEPTEDEQLAITESSDPWERRAMDDGIAWEGRSWDLMRELGARSPVLGSGARFVDGRWRLSVGQLAWRRRKIVDKLGDERSFRQENPAWPDEGFLASGAQFLEEELLDRLRREAKAPKLRGGLVRINSGLVFKSSEQGYFKVWDEPDLAHHYVIGADTASGSESEGNRDDANERGGRDFSVAEVIRLSYKGEDGTWMPARIVAELHGRMVPEIFAALLWDLGIWYSCPRPGSKTLRVPALIGVERNHSSGETVLTILDEGRYPELYVHRQPVRTMGRPTRMIGWSTDVTTRQLMLDEFAAGLRFGDLEAFSPDLAREARTFVRDPSTGVPAAQEGVHDDRFMAAAIAWQMTRWHTGHGSAAPEVEFKPGKGPARV